MKSYKIDMSHKLVGLDGEPIKVPIRSDENEVTFETFSVGSQVAQALAKSGESADPVKFWAWAQDLNGGGVINVDESDQTKIRKFVEKEAGMTVALRAQALQAVDSAVESTA